MDHPSTRGSAQRSTGELLLMQCGLELTSPGGICGACVPSSEMTRTISSTDTTGRPARRDRDSSFHQHTTPPFLHSPFSRLSIHTIARTFAGLHTIGRGGRFAVSEVGYYNVVHMHYHHALS